MKVGKHLRAARGSGAAVTVVLALGLWAVGGVPASAPALAQPVGSVAEKLEEVFKCYSELEFERGIAVANDLLAVPELSTQDQIAIYSLLSMLTFAQGDQYINTAYGYLQKIAQVGPCVIPLPSEYWPQALRDHWYRMLHASGAMVCPEPAFAAAGTEPGAEPGAPRPRTIAVMEFDNFSTGDHQEKLGYLTKGLADFFEADFAQVGTLKVVERDKIDFIKNEILLVKDDMVGPDTAVRVGKLLGAQVMVFGSIVQLDDQKAKMLVKAVDVETSEILAFCEREGKPDFFKMQEEMVVELAEKLEPKLQDQEAIRKEAFRNNGTRSEAAAELYSQGLYYMDHYEYAEAYAYFKRAYEADNSFAEAKRKMDVYRPLVLSS